jgi:zinc protease
MGEPFAVRDPTALLLQAHLPPGGSVDRVLETIDEELDRLATGGPAAGELERIQARMAAQLLRDTDSVLGRGLTIAVLELQRGDPGLANRLPELVGSVTGEQLVAAAGRLQADRRAAIEVVPG